MGLFEATEGSTDSSPSLLGIEPVLWPRAAKKSGNWHRGIVNAAERFMARWHRGEAEKSWQDECRNKMVDRVARYRFD